MVAILSRPQCDNRNWQEDNFTKYKPEVSKTTLILYINNKK